MNIPVKVYEKIDKEFEYRNSIGDYLVFYKETLIVNEGGTLYAVYTI